MLKKCDRRTDEQTNLCIELRYAQLKIRAWKIKAERSEVISSFLESLCEKINIGYFYLLKPYCLLLVVAVVVIKCSSSSSSSNGHGGQYNLISRLGRASSRQDPAPHTRPIAPKYHSIFHKKPSPSVC